MEAHEKHEHHRKRNIQVLVAFVVFYFAGIGVLLLQGSDQDEASGGLDASIVSYASTAEEGKPLTQKEIQSLISEKQKLQERADKFTENGEIERAKNTYNRIIILNDRITKAVNEYSQ